jgi:hypothetical protein
LWVVSLFVWFWAAISPLTLAVAICVTLVLVFFITAASARHWHPGARNLFTVAALLEISVLPCVAVIMLIELPPYRRGNREPLLLLHLCSIGIASLVMSAVATIDARVRTSNPLLRRLVLSLVGLLPWVWIAGAGLVYLLVGSSAREATIRDVLFAWSAGLAAALAFAGLVGCGVLATRGGPRAGAGALLGAIHLLSVGLVAVAVWFFWLLAGGV